VIRGLTRNDRRIAAVVFVVALAALVGGSRSQGNTRDEGYYFDAAELYWSWYGDLLDNLVHLHPQRSFTRAAVERGFSYNHEHPALMKSLFGLSWRVLHKCNCPAQGGRHPFGYAKKHTTLGLLDEETALRLPTHIVCALMVMLVYLLAAAAWSRAAGYRRCDPLSIWPRSASPSISPAGRGSGTTPFTASANMPHFTCTTFITTWSISGVTITSRPFRSRSPT
jgi:hypothetical protein